MNHHQRRRFEGRGADGYGRPVSGRLRHNDIVGSLTDSVRDNPAAAALIGMGVVWLFMGGNRVSLLGSDGRTSALGAVAHGAGEAAQGAGHMASRMGGAVASTVSSAASNVSEGVTSAAHRVGEYVGGSAHGVNAEDEYRNREWMDDGMRNAAHSHDPRRASTIRSLRHGMQNLFERHPMALGLAGLALGAGVAASLPLTETEREAGEAVRSKVSETASQAKEIAGAVAEEVKRQAG
jgi:hypothetical protein